MNFTDLLPPLRQCIEIELTKHEGEDVILLHDPEGISDQNIMLEAGLLHVLNNLSGEHSINSLFETLSTQLNAELDFAELAAFVNALDDACLLDSEKYFDTRLFLDSDVRHAICDGICYPADTSELHSFIDAILNSSPVRSYLTNAKAIVVPHIDLRVDPNIYAAPFNAIRDSEFDTVIHIGTSHYGWQDQFILSEKDFITPLGRLRTDKEFIETLRNSLPFELTRNDIAHKPEHALELHHIFLQHLFPQRNFTIVPILVTSFHAHVSKQRDPVRDTKIDAFCTALKSIVDASGRKALWIVSGDLAHIGQRFGDEWKAESVLDTLRSEDFEIMNAMVQGKASEYFHAISRNHDQRRICGLPPVWTMLQSLKPGKGTALGYEQWNDAGTGSAVSYGSAAWW